MAACKEYQDVVATKLGFLLQVAGSGLRVEKLEVERVMLVADVNSWVVVKLESTATVAEYNAREEKMVVWVEKLDVLDGVLLAEDMVSSVVAMVVVVFSGRD